MEESLQERLVACTIGGAAKTQRDVTTIREVFSEYVRAALPGFQVLSVEPIITSASLNSIIARVGLQKDGVALDTVAKVHIESHTGASEISSAAGVHEYEHAMILDEFGWPALAPIDVEFNPDYPILVYPYLADVTYFDLLEQSYSSQSVSLTDEQLQTFEHYDHAAGRVSVGSARAVPRSQVSSGELAPVQALFYDRVKSGGRIDQWYQSGTKLFLPGSDPITWQDIKLKKWQINGVEYDYTLHEIIELSRVLLAYDGLGETVVAISHGDDHAGNIFLNSETRRAVSFDPAFSGWNPGALCHVKSFMHTGILPMAGLYYPPRLARCEYVLSDTRIEVQIDWASSPAYEVHQRLARSTVVSRIVPLFRRMQELGASVALERSRFAMAASTCCYLVINVANLLESVASGSGSPLGGSTAGGSGEALLPLTVMCAAMRGLPQLEYLRDSIDALA
jgi:hypothetical protein